MATVDEAGTTEAKAEGGGARGRTERSETAYPYYGLSNAIGVVEAVRRAGGNEAPSAEVMRELNIPKTTDRGWAYGIPAAVQYGLVERVGRGETGRIKLTDLGLRVALPANEEEARAAKVAAFKQPELFTKLLERFAGHPVPSKEGLRNILHRDYKIVESMAPVAADAFIDSLKVAGLVNASNAITVEVSAAGDDQPVKADPQKPKPSQGMQVLQVPADFVIYKCKIGKGQVIDIPLPPDFTTAQAERLHAFLLTQVDDDAPGGGEERRE